MALLDLVDSVPGTGQRCFGRAWAAAAALALLALGVCAGLVAAAEESPQALEQKIKAAFLFKFGGYVEWPDSAFPGKDAPLVIGVAGADVLADELSQVVAGRTMNGRQVAVRRVTGGEPVSNLHMLFIGRSESARLNELDAQARPLLTVTDAEKGIPAGSIINFVVVDKRVRFEVALDSAKRSGLRISAPLLSVALHVRE